MTLKYLLPEHLHRHLRIEMTSLGKSLPPVDCQSCQRPAKCCDYWPFLPNFNVPSALPENQLENWLTQRRALLPIGIVAPSGFRKRRDSLGDVTCPFFTEDRKCRVWRQRPSECATYFCVQAEGENEFWQAMNTLLHYYEQGLAQWWMLESGFEWHEIRSQARLLVDESDRWQFPAAEFENLWAHYHGKECEYFHRAQEWYESLDRNAIEKLMGPSWLRMEEAALTSLREALRAKT
jgi:hypothetical protein